MIETNRHFSGIAPRYNQLRTTDPDVAEFIASKLCELRPVRVADVCCGTGRYDLDITRWLGEKLDLICVDANISMLHAFQSRVTERELRKPMLVLAQAHTLPLQDGLLDSVLILNAIHLVDVTLFLRECRRTLRSDGLLVIYTRLRSQNKRTIWGRYFPSFHEKDWRLFEQEQLESLIDEVPDLSLEEVKHFSHSRQVSLDRLTQLAQGHHYSTFALYDTTEFERALEQFQRNVRQMFPDPEQVTWQDENTFFAVRRGR